MELTALLVGLQDGSPFVSCSLFVKNWTSLPGPVSIVLMICSLFCKNHSVDMLPFSPWMLGISNGQVATEAQVPMACTLGIDLSFRGLCIPLRDHGTVGFGKGSGWPLTSAPGCHRARPVFLSRDHGRDMCPSRSHRTMAWRRQPHRAAHPRHLWGQK